MLQDFYMLELYFGSVESAQSFESLVRKYGHKAVIKNISDGFLQKTSMACCGNSRGFFVWLSEKGRQTVTKRLSEGKT